MEHPGLRNLSMKVAEEGREIVFLKRVVEGPSNNSYGIHVARLAGVPGEVVDRAEELLHQLLKRSGEEVPSASVGAIPGTGKRTGASGAGASRAAGGPTAPREEPQGALFGEDEMIRSELSGLDVDRLTPLEALNLLSEWKRRLREK
jgi:DNA mismatch repair protein MutS